MFIPRVIPVLLLKGQGLYKSVKFKDYKYIGDPINAVKIFNDLFADELVFLDVTASLENRCISKEFVKMVGDEANMPFAVGGGISTIGQIKDLVNAGAEKVVLGTIAAENPAFVKEASDYFGSSTIVVCIDIKKKFLGKKQVWIRNGQKNINSDPVDYARQMENMGAGEIIIQSIEQDGIMTGYDFELTKNVAMTVNIPVVAMGGASQISDFKKVVKESYASAAAAGSLFVYHGPRKAVLISYPSKRELINIFE
jgi:cyclase